MLERIFDEVKVVDVLDSGDTAHLAMMKRPDLGVTFTKLHCWTLTDYSKCVFMDADTLVGINKIFNRKSSETLLCLGSNTSVFIPGAFKYRRTV